MEGVEFGTGEICNRLFEFHVRCMKYNRNGLPKLVTCCCHYVVIMKKLLTMFC